MLRWETNMKSRYLSCDVLRIISFWLFFGKIIFWTGNETQCIWDNKQNLIIHRYTDSNSQTKMSIIYHQGDILDYTIYAHIFESCPEYTKYDIIY